MFEKIMADAERRLKERQAEYETLSQLTGKSIAELDIDLTSRDPKNDNEEY